MGTRAPGTSVAAAAVRTTVGMVRTRNEDSAYVDPGKRYFVVADGMGGHSCGDIASAMAVGSIRESLDAAAEWLDELASMPATERAGHARDLLERAIRVANECIYERSLRERDKYGMGTTLEVVLVVGDQAYIAHAGDSRTYLIRRGDARLATVDHTIAQAMVEAGSITEEQALRSPMRTTLCNAIGIGTRIRIDHIALALEPGDVLLVCTDGLYDYFDRPELARLLTASSSDGALEDLIGEACARGGHDNATGIAIEMTPQVPLHIVRETSEPITMTLTLEY